MTSWNLEWKKYISYKILCGGGVGGGVREGGGWEKDERLGSKMAENPASAYFPSNPFMPNGLFHLISLCWSFSNRRGVWLLVLLIVWFITYPVFNANSVNPDISKQCRPRSDAAYCGVGSGSTLLPMSLLPRSKWPHWVDWAVNPRYKQCPFYGTLGIKNSNHGIKKQ